MGLTRENHTGNLLILFHVDFPEKMSDEKILAIGQILYLIQRLKQKTNNITKITRCLCQLERSFY